MKLKNIEMEQRLTILEPYLDRKDIIGYAAARNTRFIRNASAEYNEYRDSLITKYGVPETDEHGNKTGRYFLTPDSPNFKQYTSEITEFALIEHEVDIFTIPFDKACGELTGREILELEWMFED